MEERQTIEPQITGLQFEAAVGGFRHGVEVALGRA